MDTQIVRIPIHADPKSILRIRRKGTESGAQYGDSNCEDPHKPWSHASDSTPRVSALTAASDYAIFELRSQDGCAEDRLRLELSMETQIG